MKVQVLGRGCPKCRKLADNAVRALGKLGLDYELEKVTDVAEIAKMGVAVTPGLAIDGEVKSSGTVLSVEEITALVRECARR